jgi:hypothetical protein
MDAGAGEVIEAGTPANSVKGGYAVEATHIASGLQGVLNFWIPVELLREQTQFGVGLPAVALGCLAKEKTHTLVPHGPLNASWKLRLLKSRLPVWVASFQAIMGSSVVCITRLPPEDLQCQTCSVQER